MDVVASHTAGGSGALVLVASTDEALGGALSSELEQLGCQVVSVTRVVDAIAELHGVEFDVAFVAMSLAPRSPIDVLRAACELSPDTENVVVLDPGCHDAPVDCVRNGAFDFLHQPLSRTEIASVLERALSRRAVRTSTAMFRASHAILGATKAQDLTRITVELAEDLLSADGVAFYRRWQDGRLEIVHASGFTRPTDVDDLSEMTRAIAEDIQSPMPILLPEDAAGRDLLGKSRIRSALLCPVIVDGTVTGILAAERSTDPRPFRRGDAERSGVLTSQLRLALENVRLVERTVAAERLAAVGELAAGVAHEINNPLTYILTNCEVAFDELEALGSLGDGLRGILTDVSDGAERIREIARDLRLLSRRTCRPGELAPESSAEVFELGEAVRTAVRVTGPTVRDWIAVETKLEADLRIAGSRGRISQVFVNLLVNAAQAAASMGERVRVEIALGRREGRVIATVRDEGPGISPEHLPRIFDAFFTTKPGDKGTGLGLSITRAIVEEHGGTIAVASELGVGTTFTIDLPARSVGAANAAASGAATAA